VVIGLIVVNPWLALPLALVSHFAMDALPHYGDRYNPPAAFRRLKLMLPFDMLLAFMVLVLIILTHPDHWPVAVAGGVLAASPDLGSIPLFVRYLRSGKIRRSTTWFHRFHTCLQWGERLWGAWIELSWFAVFGSLLLARL
jgi:hypothetical protein